MRPILTYRSNLVMIMPGGAQRVLTVRATPEQLTRVRTLLDAYESTASTACAAKPLSR
ncbi:MAG: hypothetical protein ACT4P7_11630 [Gemmatimonadaceae bacterium]